MHWSELMILRRKSTSLLALVSPISIKYIASNNMWTISGLSYLVDLKNGQTKGECEDLPYTVQSVPCGEPVSRTHIQKT